MKYPAFIGTRYSFYDNTDKKRMEVISKQNNGVVHVVLVDSVVREAILSLIKHADELLKDNEYVHSRVDCLMEEIIKLS
jgi:hypothetical protein